MPQLHPGVPRQGREDRHALRCAFCNNRRDATEDATLHGTPDYVRNTGEHIEVPRALPSDYDRPEPTFDIAGIIEGRKGKSLVNTIIGVAAVLLVLGLALRSCW